MQMPNVNMLSHRLSGRKHFSMLRLASSTATLYSNSPQQHKRKKLLYYKKKKKVRQWVLQRCVVSSACCERSEQAMTKRRSELSKKGTPTPSSPRCNNKGILPTPPTSLESSPTPGSQPTAGKEPAARPGRACLTL